jgi:3-hydroxyacyl-CoA dehydrogenase
MKLNDRSILCMLALLWRCHRAVQGVEPSRRSSSPAPARLSRAAPTSSEFNTPKALAEPTLHTRDRVIRECSTKPVVAAIHASAWAAAWNWRSAAITASPRPGAQIALPEVKLGLVPGAGGTQRLPRVVGLEGLNMIVSGTPVPSEKLAETKLFDKMFADGADLQAAAVAFANKVADVRPLPKVRDLKVDYPNYEAFLQFSRNTVKAMAGPFPAPLECVEASPPASP